MDLTDSLKRKLSPVYRPLVARSPTLVMLTLLAKGKVDRRTDWVSEKYGAIWADYRGHLDRATRLEDWLHIPGFDDEPSAFHIDGRVEFTRFDHLEFYVDLICETIRSRFPNARSITEYGCGTGRNLLAIKSRMPHLACYGYELAQPGVEIGRAAAKKFGLDVSYAPLDYVNDGEEKYVHPKTDLALTVYSIEQIPHANAVAVKNMLDHSKLGSIHLEPVAENYPWTYRGLLGRLYTHQIDLMRNFDGAVAAMKLKAVHRRVLDTSQNPLMYPTLYALEK